MNSIGEQLLAFKRDAEQKRAEAMYKRINDVFEPVDEDDPLTILLRAEAQMSEDEDSTYSAKDEDMNDSTITLTQTDAKKVNEKLETYRASILATREAITKAEAHRATLDKDLVRLKAKGKYLKNDDEIKAATEALAEISADLEELTDALHAAETGFNQELEKDIHDSLLNASRGLKFGIPVSANQGSNERTVTDYALLRCNILGAIARALQDTIVTGEDYFLRELARAYGDNGETNQIGTAPAEITERSIERVEQLKSFREFVTMLRMVAERQFRDALDDIPETSVIRPRMLWQTDEDAKARYDQRRVARAEAQRADVTKAMTTELKLARLSTSAYKPSREVL